MSQAIPSYIQVAADGAGKKVRNIEVSVPVPSTGAENTVEIQVVALADRQGNLLEALSTESVQLAILEELREIKFLLMAMATNHDD